MLLVGVQNENKSTDQKWHPSVQSKVFHNSAASDHSKHHPNQPTFMHKASSNIAQSKDSTECSQNPHCIQPTLLPTSVFLLLPQTFVLPNQTHPQCSHILANYTASESRQGQMKSVALTTPSQSEPPSPISLLKSLRLVSTLTASLVSF